MSAAGKLPGGQGTSLRCCVMRRTLLDMARIRAVRRVIDPIFLDTPLYRCEALEPDLGCAVSIKLETANPVGSFKARGTEVVRTKQPQPPSNKTMPRAAAISAL
jgi:threonine dehydratase